MIEPKVGQIWRSKQRNAFFLIERIFETDGGICYVTNLEFPDQPEFSVFLQTIIEQAELVSG